MLDTKEVFNCLGIRQNNGNTKTSSCKMQQIIPSENRHMLLVMKVVSW